MSARAAEALARQIANQPQRTRRLAPAELISAALTLDQRLMSGAFDAEPAQVIEVVTALLAIRDGLQARSLPELAQWRTANSPLDGIVEDIAPFGNSDQWIAKRSQAQRARSASQQGRRRREPVPPTGDEETETEDPHPPQPPPGNDTRRRQAQTGHQQTEEDIVDRAERGIAAATPATPDGGPAATVGTATDVAGVALDVAGYLTEAILVETVSFAVSAVLAPLQGVIATIGFFSVMIATTRVTEQGIKGCGAKLAVLALDPHIWRPFPDTLSVRIIEANQQAMFAGGPLLASANRPTYGMPDGNGRRALVRQGMQEVCAVINQAVNLAENRRQIADALQRADAETRRSVKQELRRRIYQQLWERAGGRG